MIKNKDLIDVLEREIETRVLPTKKYPYVPAAAIRSRLNEAFGALWNTHILSSDIIDEETVLILLELTCFVGDTKIVKEGYGSALIQKYNSGINKGKPVNLSDAYGNALTDSIKACAKQMGIGNKEMDVKKDTKTGKYVRVDGVETNELSVEPAVVEHSGPEKTKILDLKKKIEANKNKTKEQPVTQEVEPELKSEPKSVIKEPVEVKEDDVPIPGMDSEEEPNKDTKLQSLKEKLEAFKKKT